MRTDALNRRIEAACKQLEEQYNQLGTSTDQHVLLKEVLEELQVAGEEMCIQNDELFSAREEIKRERERYEDLFNFAPDCYLLTDARGVIQEANHAAAGVLNVDLHFLIGQPLLAYVAQDQHKQFHELLRWLKTHASGRVPQWELWLKPLGSDPVPVDITVGAVRDQRNMLVGIRWLLHSIVERKRAEEARAQAEQMKDEFIANVSHELRTPLHSIMGSTRLMLQGDVPDTDTQREFLGIIDSQSEHLAELIDNLIDVSRLESGRFAINKHLLSIEDVIHSAVEEVTGLASAKGIAIVGHLPDALPMVEADEKRLRQLLVNLLGNAIKFSVTGGGDITVRVENKRHEIVVRVTDVGIGIPVEALSSLGERFYQADGSSTRRTGGSGLGLFIAKQIVQGHGGRMWARSVVGKGSTFSFTLPLKSLSRQRGRSHEKETAASRG